MAKWLMKEYVSGLDSLLTCDKIVRPAAIEPKDLTDFCSRSQNRRQLGGFTRHQSGGLVRHYSGGHFPILLSLTPVPSAGATGPRYRDLQHKSWRTSTLRSDRQSARSKRRVRFFVLPNRFIGKTKSSPPHSGTRIFP